MKEVNITKNDENQRLDKYLLKYFNKAPKSFIYKMLRKKRIKYNSKKAEGNEILKNGDLIQIYLSEETMDGFMEERKISAVGRDFDIIYEDENVIFMVKPIGVLTHPEKSTDKNTLVDQLLFYLNQKGEYNPSKDNTFTPAVCNRLDRNTGGIVIAGKNLMAVQELNRIIAKRSIKKLYITVVKGVIKKQGKVIGYLTKDSSSNTVKITSNPIDGAKKIITKFEPVKSNENYTLMEIDLITGKSHQIRAQMAYMGNPLIGDRKYGDPQVNRYFKDKFGLNNQYLFAHKVIWEENTGCLGYLNGKIFEANIPEVYGKINSILFDNLI